jgi:nucleoside-diphosphate-sugar epimerase
MNVYANQNVVVTGGAGFIGINLVWELCNLGARVTVLDLPSADFSLLPADINIVRGDILDPTVCESACANADYVFHLAAKTDLSGKKLEDYAANYDGTKNIIESVKSNQHIKRFVLFSTQLVVGIFNETRFIDQNEPYKTKTLYGQSKITAEKITIQDCQKYHIPFIIIRPTSVYGQYGREPYRDFFLAIKSRRYFHVGRADNLISMVYVKNVVDQTLFLSSRHEANGQVFFSNDLIPYTMRQFSDAIGEYFGYRIVTIPDFIVYPAAYLLGILKAFGINVPLYPFRLNNLKANYCYSIGNSIELGFFPKYSLREGVKESLDWYVNHDSAFEVP